jgi:ketosteroid isomerase-like protein
MGQARELMDRATTAVLAGELDALRDIYAEDVIASTPDEGTLNGIDAYLEWNRSFIASFSDRSSESQREFETEDCAIDQGYFVATHSKDLALPGGQTLPASGKRIRVRAVDLATVRDGKIVQHDFYFDQLDMLMQLGMTQVGLAESR